MGGVFTQAGPEPDLTRGLPVKALMASKSPRLPELARLPAGLIRRPWSTTPLELAAAGVALRKTYPEPIIDHSEGREHALNAYTKVRAR
jgi:hypothetical protein